MEPILDHELVNKTTNLLSILSKRDALSIFLLAKDGLKAETDTPQKIGLTRKQYYTRLRQLVDTDLVAKAGDLYVHTTLGTFVHEQHLVGLLEHVRNAKQLKMIDTLKNTRQFSEQEISSFVNRLTGTSIGETVASSPIKIATSYEDMVNSVIEQIQLCKHEILLASRFQNDLIINNILRKASGGTTVRVIGDMDLIKNYLKNVSEKLQESDKHAMERVVVAGDPWYPKHPNADRKLRDVPFCMLIVDGKSAGLEIIDRFKSDSFRYAIFAKDEVFAEELRKVFESWWVSASEDNLEKIFQEVIASK